MEKWTLLWREGHFQVKMLKDLKAHKNTTCADYFWKLRCWKSVRRCGAKHLLCGRRNGFGTLPKVRTWGFCSIFKNNGRRGKFEDLRRCISRHTHSTRDMFIRDVRRSARWFPGKGCILEHQIFRFAKMILRDRRSTSYDLASLFRGRSSALDRWSGNIWKIAQCMGTRPSAPHSTFDFWRKSRRIALFWCCQLQKMRKSRRVFRF